MPVVTSQPQAGELFGATVQPCPTHGTLVVVLTYGEGVPAHDATVTLVETATAGTVVDNRTTFRLADEQTYTVHVTSARWGFRPTYSYRGVVQRDHHTVVAVDLVVQPVLVRILDVAGTTAAGPKRWKVYRNDVGNVIVEAETDPNEAGAWEQIGWGGDVAQTGPGDQANRKVIARDTVREVALTAALGGVTDQVTVAICQLPAFAVNIVRFMGRCSPSTSPPSSQARAR